MLKKQHFELLKLIENEKKLSKIAELLNLTERSVRYKIDEINEEIGSKKIEIKKPIINLNVIRGALALACLTIGANIAFGNITASMTGKYEANIDHLTIYSGLADAVSSLFGGGPVEAIISATAAAPNPLASGILMMAIMAAILIFGLLPKISKYIPGHSVHGFLFILGAIVTVPTNASLAFSGGTPQDYVVAATAMTVTAANDPFIGLLVALVVKYIFVFIG